VGGSEVRKVFLAGLGSTFFELSLLADVLVEEGVEVFRPDRLCADRGWQEEILSAIKRCDVFVAVLENASPNVMFELGYALGAGKRVLLCRTNGSEIPFDIEWLQTKFIDLRDPRSIFEAVNWIKEIAISSSPPSTHLFKGAHHILSEMCA